MELISTFLYNEITVNPLKPTKVRQLNLSKNTIGKDGLKILASSFEKNTSVEVLDLSQCHIGVSGTQTLATSL